jgi:hypothetical protein
MLTLYRAYQARSSSGLATPFWVSQTTNGTLHQIWDSLICWTRNQTRWPAANVRSAEVSFVLRSFASSLRDSCHRDMSHSQLQDRGKPFIRTGGGGAVMFLVRDKYKNKVTRILIFPSDLGLFDRLCGLVVRVLDYRCRGPRFDSRALQKKSSGSGTKSTQPREYNWGATW